MEKVTFSTDDGITIVGDYQEGEAGGKAALFLHMMPATRESWGSLAAALAERGFSTLAIDLRGHGESTAGAGGETLHYKTFSDAQHRATIKDVEAAARWLTDRGASLSRLAIVGASIGANLAIVFSSQHPEVPATAALSPGIEYHGVATDAAAAMMPRSQKLLLAASAEDDYVHASCVALTAKKTDAEFHPLDGAGHGTAMLAHEPGFFAYLVEWIFRNVR